MAKKKVEVDVVSENISANSNDMRVKCVDKRFVPLAKTGGAAGVDLHLMHDVVIRQDEVVMVGTGVYVEIPEGHFGIVALRSSIHSVSLTNAIGIIDSDYRGEIKLKIRGEERITRFSTGERIAQLIVLPYMKINPVVVESLEDTERGEGGFGSTGTN